jgi:hypothetical protein
VQYSWRPCRQLPPAQDANPLVKSRSEGFFVGVAYEGNGFAFEDADATDSGPGVGVTVGYGFHPNFSAYAQFSAASVDGGLDEKYGVAHIDIGTRVHFRAPAKTVVPYLRAGLSSCAFQQDVDTDEIKGSGLGFAFGGGINAHFIRRSPSRPASSGRSATPATSRSMARSWTWSPSV